jgi:BA14K-like protein
MNLFAKFAVLGLATAATVVAPLSQSVAGDNNWRHRPRQHNNGDALIAGAIGLAAGAIILGSINQANSGPRVIYDEPMYDEPVYVDPDYYPPQPRAHVIRRPVRQPHVIHYDEYAGNFEPWSRDWFRYCANRYRSFDPQTGTYRGYDGRDHFCTAR